MTDVVANLNSIRAHIAASCAAVGRAPGEVRLLPVSKTMGVDKILALHAAGENMFGENRVQEAEAKAKELAGTGIRWSVVGHLQTNKARHLAQFADEFQALDSLRVAAELDKRLQAQGRAIDVMVQVNSSAEPQKFGLPAEEVEAFTEQLGAYHSLRVKGLMTLAVFSDDRTVVEPCFVRMAQLREQLRNNDRAAGSYEELSMGMSGDFELAIAHGATCIRIGQAIFGARLDPNAYWATAK